VACLQEPDVGAYVLIRFPQGDVYEKVIQGVVAGVRTDFDEYGVNPATLDQLQQVSALLPSDPGSVQRKDLHIITIAWVSTYMPRRLIIAAHARPTPPRAACAAERESKQRPAVSAGSQPG
jgi:hypothetical protein